MIHLAKSPQAAGLVSWCGMSEGTGKSVGRTRNGDEIARFVGWDCPACRARIEAESARLLAILGALDGIPERAATLALGCGDNSCRVRRPGGLGTNGRCRCEPRELAAAGSAWRRYAMALEARR